MFKMVVVQALVVDHYHFDLRAAQRVNSDGGTEYFA